MISTLTGYDLRGAHHSLSLHDLERIITLGRARKPIHYVDSNATGTGTGKSWTNAFTTLVAAIAASEAEASFMVAPMHVETVIAAAGLVPKAGQTFIGFGNSGRCPQVNFTTAAGADMDIDVAGVTFINFRFTGSIDALTGPIDVNAADFTMIDCITEDASGVQATDFIVVDANGDRLRLIRWTHKGDAAAGADTAISFLGADQVVIEDPWIDGNFAVAAIENVSAAATGCAIYGGMRRPGYIRTRNAADVAVTLVATATGNVGPGLYARLADNAANVTEAFVGADAQFFRPIEIVNLAAETSMGTNIAASTDA